MEKNKLLTLVLMIGALLLPQEVGAELSADRVRMYAAAIGETTFDCCEVLSLSVALAGGALSVSEYQSKSQNRLDKIVLAGVGMAGLYASSKASNYYHDVKMHYQNKVLSAKSPDDKKTIAEEMLEKNNT